MPALLPISIFEQFTNFITLALRLYGNIYAGEVLLKLIYNMANSKGVLTYIPAIPLEIIWQDSLSYRKYPSLCFCHIDNGIHLSKVEKSNRGGF